MFDTVAFNRIVEKEICVESLAPCGAILYATHVQKDEIKNTSNCEKRNKLLEIFQFATEIPTEGVVLGVSRLGQAKFSGDNMFEDFRSDMNKCEKKKNNTQDTLIAVTAIKNGFTLVTDDECLRKVAKKHSGDCITFKAFWERCQI